MAFPMDFARRLKPAHLRLIVKMSETGKLQAAADALGMSQPAASRILSEIETDIGARLFMRLPRGIEPTPLGEAFLRHARAVLSALDNLEAEVRGINLGLAGEVRVGSVTGPAVKYLAPAILRIRTSAPDIEPTFEVGPSSGLVRGLAEGRFDFVIARLPTDHDSRAFHMLPARWEAVSLLVRAGHPLAGRPRVALGDLTRYPWVIQERGSPIRDAVEGAFAAAGVAVPATITNSSSLLVMLSLLEKSDTVAPLSEEVAALLTRAGIGARLAVLDLDREIAVSPYFIIRNRHRPLSRAAERLLDEVLAEL